MRISGLQVSIQPQIMGAAVLMLAATVSSRIVGIAGEDDDGNSNNPEETVAASISNCRTHDLRLDWKLADRIFAFDPLTARMGKACVEHQRITFHPSRLNEGYAIGRQPFANGVDAPREVGVLAIEVRIDRRLAGIVNGPLRLGQRSADLIRLFAGFHVCTCSIASHMQSITAPWHMPIGVVIDCMCEAIEQVQTWKSSEQTNEISAALAKAQGAINNPGKAAINPHFNSHYADLSGGINAIREGMSTNGIAVIQATRVEGDVLMLDTRLAHSSGQWIECEYPVCKFPIQPQIMGAAVTYARRYSLFGIVGIAGEDDDGNTANAAKVDAPQAKAFITAEDAEELDTLLSELDEKVQEGFMKYFKVEFVGRLPATDYATAKAMLKKKKAAQDDREARAKAAKVEEPAQ